MKKIVVYVENTHLGLIIQKKYTKHTGHSQLQVDYHYKNTVFKSQREKKNLFDKRVRTPGEPCFLMINTRTLKEATLLFLYHEKSVSLSNEIILVAERVL